MIIEGTKFLCLYKICRREDFYTKKVMMDGKEYKLQVWVNTEEERFQFLLRSYIRGSNGVILMYDITRTETLNMLSESSLILSK